MVWSPDYTPPTPSFNSIVKPAQAPEIQEYENCTVTVEPEGTEYISSCVVSTAIVSPRSSKLEWNFDVVSLISPN
jgi:hypothetical protein